MICARRVALAGLLFSSACASVSAPRCDVVPPSDGCTRVLFLGNSFTAVNDLPAVFTAVSTAHGRSVYAEMIAPGGARLADHLAQANVIEKIHAGRWNYVVLQEQSVTPAFERNRLVDMYPAARQLVDEIRHAGARPVFYATWGRRDGFPEGGLRDYAAMQAQVTQGYRAIAEELHAIVVPVGDAWEMVAGESPDIPLWQADGSHPTVQGTFLAANVFVATLFHVAPHGLGTRSPVPEAQVYRLQQAAARAAGLPAGVPR